MNEDYLHHIWKYQLFSFENLRTVNGERLEVVRPGYHNKDSGPDFFDGRIRIDNTRWAGNVEIHVNSSDWNKHRHSSDPAYGNVILHVVYNHDAEINDIRNRTLPTLELKNRIDEDQYHLYLSFISKEKIIPCANFIGDLNEIIVRQQIDRSLVARLERKFFEVERILEQARGDWEQTAYVMLAKNFGFRVNAIPFEALAWITPHSLLQRASNNLLRMEALLFGQAALLPESSDDEYVMTLIREYNLLKTMYGFSPVESGQWKFSRMRPVNFPTIRISQFAAIVRKVPSLFRFLTEFHNAGDLIDKLSVEASGFWNSHYTFKRLSPVHSKQLGEQSIYNITINTIVPLLFTYGKIRQEQQWCEKAISILEMVPAEDNQILRKWSKLGLTVEKAYESQGLIELKNEWCSRKKCLNCIIGNQILREQYDKTDIRLL